MRSKKRGNNGTTVSMGGSRDTESVGGNRASVERGQSCGTPCPGGRAVGAPPTDAVYGDRVPQVLGADRALRAAKEYKSGR